jgi:hypothetical protein
MAEVDKVKELEERIALYENPGAAALFFALNRKMNEIAGLLNAVNLKSIDMAAKGDATFERVFKLLEKSEGISSAAKALGDFAGVNNESDESAAVKPVYRRVTTPESIADGVGELAGKKN